MQVAQERGQAGGRLARKSDSATLSKDNVAVGIRQSIGPVCWLSLDLAEPQPFWAC